MALREKSSNVPTTPTTPMSDTKTLKRSTVLQTSTPLPSDTSRSPRSKRKRVSFLEDMMEVQDIDIDDKDGDEDDLELTQIRDFQAPNWPEVGIIEKVSMTNFMCHSHLEVVLGLNVNFIVGRNGSGKSALLSALIVGLGGKAGQTSRGNSLKSFVKTGCTAAKIEVTIRNQGTEAYKRELYGHSIIVERKVSVDGSGGYKIKSALNVVVSTRKKDLVSILDNFNIQIDNPVAILTQDVSRNFLATSNSKKKYELFLKATLLERLSQDYDHIVAQNKIAEEVLRKKKVEVFLCQIYSLQ